ncbi:hypothetical protein SEA_KALAH2_62 [Mycobacterium phage Kalah2]|nr:hypothetical protein SEA_KLEIN_67 [Mycobacterium phage Klein]AYB69549.1 hypothetical protein SEA_KALAH2_62 [Mycobacterium phage Kalah2]
MNDILKEIMTELDKLGLHRKEKV